MASATRTDTSRAAQRKKMDKPLTQWYCDVCGEPIDTPDRAYVIWKSDPADQHRDHSFKIIHQKRCDRDDHHLSAELKDFLGADGLAKLLSMVSYGPLKDSKSAGVKDMDEWVDFVRRCQIPYYEEARRRFHDPDIQEDLYDANEVFPYLTDSLKSIIKR
jgi:hypothetical protein